MTWALRFGSGLIALVVASISLKAWGEHRWRRQVTALRTSLDGGPDAAATRMRYDVRELEGLPAPVRRYFRSVLEDGQPVIAAVTVDMAGTFNMSSTGEQWKHFTSRQRVVTRRPGFVWDANIALAPGMSARVVDSCIAGKGLLRTTLQGLFTMAEQTGDDIDHSEFMRWCAEMPWYPTALLPSQGVRWHPGAFHRRGGMDASRRPQVLFQRHGHLAGVRVLATILCNGSTVTSRQVEVVEERRLKQEEAVERTSTVGDHEMTRCCG